MRSEVSVQDVFRYQTIASFPEHIEAVTERHIHEMPDPLIHLDSGNHAMNRCVFDVLQILGLVVMTIP